MKLSNFSILTKDSRVVLEFYDPEKYEYADHTLNEEEVRRLHSFLSQWLEKNQNDYF